MYRTLPPEVGQQQSHHDRKYDFKQVEGRKESVFFFFFYLFLYALTGKAMAPHPSTLAWKIPWTEEPGELQSMGSLRVRHDWATSLSLFTLMHWRRKWQPTPVLLPGESQGRGSLVGCPSMGSHRVGHDWSDLAAAAAYALMPIGLENPCWPNVPAQNRNRICSEGDGGMWITSDESMYIYSLWNPC